MAIGYTISSLDSNESILEKMDKIEKFLKDNVMYNIYMANSQVNSNGYFLVSNIINSGLNTIDVNDLVLSSDGYLYPVTSISDTYIYVSINDKKLVVPSVIVDSDENIISSNATTSAEYSVSIGDAASTSGTNSVAIGANAIASGFDSVAIGNTAAATGVTAIQLGVGTNNTNNSLKFMNKYIVVNGKLAIIQGGTSGQVLAKASDNDYDYKWVDVESDLNTKILSVSVHQSNDTTESGNKKYYVSITDTDGNTFNSNAFEVDLEQYPSGLWYDSDTNSYFSEGSTLSSNRRDSISIGHLAGGYSSDVDMRYSISIGDTAKTENAGCITIGETARSSINGSISIGMAAAATGYSDDGIDYPAVAIGELAVANGQNAIQLGKGTNNTANSLQYIDTPVVVDGSIAVLSGGTSGQVLAKASNNDYDYEWVDQSSSGSGGGTSTFSMNDTTGNVTLGNNVSFGNYTNSVLIGNGTITDGLEVLKVNDRLIIERSSSTDSDATYNIADSLLIHSSPIMIVYGTESFSSMMTNTSGSLSVTTDQEQMGTTPVVIYGGVTDINEYVGTPQLTLYMYMGESTETTIIYGGVVSATEGSTTSGTYQVYMQITDSHS